MNIQLETSGVLNQAESPPQPSPENQAARQQFGQPYLANTRETKHEEFVRKLSNWRDLAVDILMKLSGLLLTAQGVAGIYSSLQFTVVRYPLLESALRQGTLTRSEVNDVIVEALVLVVTTVVSLVFAVRLTFMINKSWKLFNAALGISLVIFISIVQNYFDRLNVIHYFSGYFDPVLSILESAGQ